MEPLTLAVAGVAALAILLIAVGVASSGRSGISDRLERYASAGGSINIVVNKLEGLTVRARPGPNRIVFTLTAKPKAFTKVTGRRDGTASP